MRRHPLVPAAVAFMAGIAAAHSLPAVGIAALAALMAAACIATGLLLLVRRPPLPALLLALLAAGGLAGRTADPAHNPRHWTHAGGGPHALVVQLEETPYFRSKTFRAHAEVQRIDGHAATGSLRLYLRADSLAASLRYGDRLLLHAYPDSTRRSAYLTPDHYLRLGSGNPTLRSHCEQARLALLERMRRSSLPQPELGVAEALALGWRADLDPATQAHFREAGIAHLLCVSGLHVGLLASMVGGLFFWTGRTRRGRIVAGTAQLIAVWLFALLSGLAPATLRAALMFSLLIVARFLDRRTSSLNLLAAAVLLSLAARPMLLYDVGWQLSYAAVAGILCARPLLGECRSPLLRSAIVSTAATLATLPILLSAFGRVQTYFLAANLLVVPASGLILALSQLCIALPHSAAVAWALGGLLRAVGRLTAFIADLPYGTLQCAPTSQGMLVAVAVAVVAVLLAIRPIVARFSPTRMPLPC